MKILRLLFSHILTILAPILAICAVLASFIVAIRDKDWSTVKDGFVIAGMMLILPLIVYVLLLLHFFKKRRIINYKDSKTSLREELSYQAFIDIFTIGNFHIVEYFSDDRSVYEKTKKTMDQARDALHKMSQCTNTKIMSTQQLLDTPEQP
jgi:ABC-type transport system involved in cytochrome bd biosynthesis fused ATPase/permease subunit